MTAPVRILVVNPNTTRSMTGKIGAVARSVAAPGTIIEAVEPTMGPASIEGFYDEAFAVPGLLEEIARGEERGIDGVVVACFDDTGLDAARSLAKVPVVGICEAALTFAARLAARISVVTAQPRSIVPLEHLVARYGLAHAAKVRAAGVAVLDLEDPASGAEAKLEAEIARAIAEDRAEAIVLGCAGMADLPKRLARQFGLPVIDGVAAAVKLVESLAALGLATSKIGAYAPPLPKTYGGLLAGFAPAPSAAR